MDFNQLTAEQVEKEHQQWLENLSPSERTDYERRVAMDEVIAQVGIDKFFGI